MMRRVGENCLAHSYSHFNTSNLPILHILQSHLNFLQSQILPTPITRPQKKPSHPFPKPYDLPLLLSLPPPRSASHFPPRCTAGFKSGMRRTDASSRVQSHGHQQHKTFIPIQYMDYRMTIRNLHIRHPTWGDSK